MTNELLIKALRCDGECDIPNCPYSMDDRDWCDENRIITDAADALEAAEHRIEDLEGALSAFRMRKDGQIPKEGEWIWENYYWHCSVCGENPTRGMGYVQGKNELFRVCPNCGAKMQTVTECHALNEKGEQE